MSRETIVALVRIECADAVARVESNAIEDQFRAAVAVAKSHWMAPTEDEQFLGAVESVYAVADESTQERILDELKMLRTMAAMISGVPVDFDAIETPENPIGLRKIFAEVG